MSYPVAGNNVDHGLLTGLSDNDHPQYAKRTVQLHVFSYVDDVTVEVGNGKAYFVVPSQLNGFDLVRASARVETAPSGGTAYFQIHNVSLGVDMLSSYIAIASGATTSTGGAVNATYKTVSTDQLIRVDVDTAFSAVGLIVTLEFEG